MYIIYTISRLLLVQAIMVLFTDLFILSKQGKTFIHSVARKIWFILGKNFYLQNLEIFQIPTGKKLSYLIPIIILLKIFTLFLKSINFLSCISWFLRVNNFNKSFSWSTHYWYRLTGVIILKIYIYIQQKNRKFWFFKNCLIYIVKVF